MHMITWYLASIYIIILVNNMIYVYEQHYTLSTAFQACYSIPNDVPYSMHQLFLILPTIFPAILSQK